MKGYPMDTLPESLPPDACPDEKEEKKLPPPASASGIALTVAGILTTCLVLVIIIAVIMGGVVVLFFVMDDPKPHTTKQAADYAAGVCGAEDITITEGIEGCAIRKGVWTVTTPEGRTFHVREDAQDNIFSVYYALQNDYAAVVTKEIFEAHAWQHLTLEADAPIGLLEPKVKAVCTSDAELDAILEEVATLSSLVNREHPASIVYAPTYRAGEASLSFPPSVWPDLHATEEAIAKAVVRQHEYLATCRTALGGAGGTAAERNVAFHSDEARMAIFFRQGGIAFAHVCPSYPLSFTNYPRDFCRRLLPEFLADYGTAPGVSPAADLQETDPFMPLPRLQELTGLSISSLNDARWGLHRPDRPAPENAPRDMAQSEAFIRIPFARWEDHTFVRCTIRTLSGIILQEDICALQAVTPDTIRGILRLPLSTFCMKKGLLTVEVQADDYTSFFNPLVRRYLCLPSSSGEAVLCPLKAERP